MKIIYWIGGSHCCSYCTSGKSFGAFWSSLISCPFWPQLPGGVTINDGIDAHICLGCGAVVRGAMLAGWRRDFSGEGERPNWSDLSSFLLFLVLGVSECHPLILKGYSLARLE